MRKAHRQKDAEALLDRRISLRCIVYDQVPTIKDEDSPESFEDIWASAAQIATVGTFVILLVTCLFVGRAILLPVVAAVVIGTTLAPPLRAIAAELEER